jgi:hypothetical protein
LEDVVRHRHTRDDDSFNLLRAYLRRNQELIVNATLQRHRLYKATDMTNDLDEGPGFIKSRQSAVLLAVE